MSPVQRLNCVAVVLCQIPHKGQPQLRLTLDRTRLGADDAAMGYHDNGPESARIADYDADRLAQWEKFAAHIGVESVLVAVKVLEGLHDAGWLKRREQRVLRLRWGLEDGQPQPLAVIGIEFSVSAQRISQVEQAAERKLKVARGRLYRATGLIAERVALLAAPEDVTPPEDDEPPPLKWHQPRPDE